MSQSDVKSDFELALNRLIDHFHHTGLLKRLKLSDEDIADTVWLAMQMGEVQTQPKPGQKDETDASTIETIRDDTSPLSPLTDPEPQVSVITDNSENEAAEQPVVKGLPFQAPAAPALQNVLELGRSLRPLMRKVPSLTRQILDEEATVNQIAERDVWLPITKAEPERWLNLELVVEESDSAFIWRETMNDLQQVFETQGAFRTVRVWSLLSDGGKLKLVQRHRSGKPSQRQHGYKELIHPNRRGAVILVSDCTSHIWQNATLHPWLKDWSEQQPTTILQLFPERLWDSTQLGRGRKLFGSAIAPGVTNPRLDLENLPSWIPIDWKTAIVLPVIQPESKPLKDWCRMVAGSSGARVPTYLFNLAFLREPDIEESPSTESAIELSAEARVTRFLATASVTAQRLAGLMAAAPVNLSVVNLIRRTLLQTATPVHVAEVYMGGLLTTTQPGSEDYDFIPEVRQALNRAMGRNETARVLDAISRYIAEQIDRPIRSFRALLALLPTFDEDDQAKVLPFAQVAVEVLQNLGGEYQQFAEDVISKNPDLQPPTPTPPPLPPEPDGISPEPQHLTEACEVAFIEVEETATFEFDVATLRLERRRELFGLLQNKKWVISKQRQRVNGFIEDLGEGVQLELVEIPAGSFLMGSPEDEPERYKDESPQHEVTVSEFLMGRFPITQAQWRAIVTQVPRIQRDLKPDPSRFKGDNRPVEQVSWKDAVEFCARLSQYTNQIYRLPSEAEWEYACRAGTTTPFHFGENISSELANYQGTVIYNDGPKGEYRRETTPVGSFEVANAFGLYDMHGNVWEWCADPWHSSYEGEPPNDGQVWDEEVNKNDNRYQIYNDENLVNLLNSDRPRVRRGGSWRYNPWFCRYACRSNAILVGYNVGFRVVRVSTRILQ
ncbi:MAG: SAV_2336 N-terminal domain-related protein [Microcoleaceae cyanobacterium]